MVKPNTIKEKYSGGPNRRARLAKTGERKVRATMLKVPAIKEANAAIPRAGPARPCRAILYPSRQVTTDAASPGIYNTDCGLCASTRYNPPLLKIRATSE